jgi:CBS domain-containing protein
MEPIFAKERTNMIVREIMTHRVWTVYVEDTLNCAAKLMLDHDCGCVPVIDAREHLVGILTDRDICRAAHEVGEALWRLRVADHMIAPVHSCWAEDSIELAEEMMRIHHVRRLPVVDHERRIVGLLSIDDLARASRIPTCNSVAGLSADAIAETLAKVAAHLPDRA